MVLVLVGPVRLLVAPSGAEECDGPIRWDRPVFFLALVATAARRRLMVVCVINPSCLVLPLGLPTEGKAEVLGLGVLGFAGAGWRIRTPDLLITNQPLYHLS